MNYVGIDHHRQYSHMRSTVPGAGPITAKSFEPGTGKSTNAVLSISCLENHANLSPKKFVHEKYSAPASAAMKTFWPALCGGGRKTSAPVPLRSHGT